MSFFSSLLGAKRKKAIEGGAQTTLDLIAYIAGLASNQLEIGPILDPVREITAQLSPGQQPSPNANQQLLHVYLQLEHYLVTKEPLRAFTKEALRKRIAAPLLAELTHYETHQRNETKV